MMPPICSVCHRDQRDEPEMEFGMVKFTDYEPLDRPGHPEGLCWFCQDHFPTAERLERHSSSEAIRRLKRHFGRPAWIRSLRGALGLGIG